MDLDFLLKWVTGRNLAALGALAGAVWLFDAYQDYPRALYDRWRAPARPAADAQGAEIMRELDVKESLRLRGLHRQVTAEIARAAAAGRQVGGLQRLADATLSLDKPRYRKIAMEKLNEVRLKIPRGDGTRAVSPEDDRFDIPPDVRGRAARRSR